MATPDVHQKKQVVIPDDAYSSFSWLIPVGGSVLFSWAVSSLVLDPLSPFIGPALWLAIYFKWGFWVIDNTEYIVIERFGEFSRIVHSGPRILCLPGLIDKIKDQGNLRYGELALCADEKDPPFRVDFDDCSTQVLMKASIRIGPQTGSIESLDKAIYLYTYTIKNPAEREERIEEILEEAVMPLLQPLKLSQALIEKDAIAKTVTADQEVRSALEAMGVELNPQKGLIIPDIILPPEVIALRQKKLEGETEASKQEELGSGYANAILGIIKAAEKAGKIVSWENAQAIYETQRGLETAVSMKTNTTFVASSMQGILNMIGVNNAHHNDQQIPTEGRVAS